MNRKKKDKKLVIFGLKDYAEIVYEYFTHDSSYEVVAFTADSKYITQAEFCGLPIVPFEEIEKIFPPSQCDFHAAIVYGRLNRIRADVCRRAKEKGYNLASYISSRCFVWHNAKIGEHCFIFEDNTIQPLVEIGNNVILWSGNHIGHSSRIGDNCFISSHVVVSGFCEIEANCFIGVNTAIGNHLKIGSESWVGQGAVIAKNIPSKSLVKGIVSEAVPLDEEKLFRYLDRIGGN